MKKTMMLMAAMMMILIVGCGGGTGVVTNGKLKGHEETTIGKAFGGSFNEAKWERKKTDKGVEYVEFTGKIKTALALENKGIMVAPQDSKVIVQFLIKGDKIEVAYAEAVMDINPTLTEEQQKAIKMKIAMEGLSINYGSSVKLNPVALDKLIHAIYN